MRYKEVEEGIEEPGVRGHDELNIFYNYFKFPKGDNPKEKKDSKSNKDGPFYVMQTLDDYLLPQNIDEHKNPFDGEKFSKEPD